MAGRPKTRAKREAEQAAAVAAGGDPERGTEADQPAPPPPADTAPRPRRSRARAAASAPAASSEPAGAGDRDRRPAKLRKIHDGLVQLFTLAGLGVGMFVDSYDGEVVVLNADRNARAWTDLAAQSPAVCRALESLLTGSAWGAAIGTTAMTALPILVRHQVLPPEAMAIAAGQGVAMPTIDQPPREAAGPQPQSFTPGAGAGEAPAPAEPATARHPMDGSAVETPVPPDPTAPAFPQPDSVAA